MTSPPSAFERTAKNSVAGMAAAFTVVGVGHPFDTLKVRLQTQNFHRPIYSGLADCFFKTLKWEGIGGLYKGVGSPLVGQMIFRSTLFASYYQSTSWMAGQARRDTGERLHWQEYFLCGAITGGVAACVETPIDLFKTQMQVEILRSKSGSSPRYRHVFHAGKVIIQNNGIRGAFQGMGATIARDVPDFAVYFGFYELCRTYFINKHKCDVTDLTVTQLLTSGSVAGFLYWFFLCEASKIYKL